MVTQKRKKRYTIAAFCQAARTAVARHAAVCKQPHSGLALVEVLRRGIRADEHSEGRKCEQATLN
jgi:hypothetical protein